MKYHLTFLLFLMTSSIVAQEVKGRNIDSIIKMDSLFFYQFDFPFCSWIKKNKNDFIFEHKVPVHDGTLKVQMNNRYTMKIDTINLDSLSDTSFLSNFFKPYGIRSETSFSSFIDLLLLMKENQITEIRPAGTGDCHWCSRYIFINKRAAFLILDKEGYCYPKNCYWRLKGTRQRKIKKDVYLIRNIKN